MQPQEPRPPLLQRLRAGHWSLLDGTVGLLYGLTAAAVLTEQVGRPWLVCLAAAGCAGGIAVARRLPLLGLACALVAAWLAPVADDVAFVALAPLAYACYHCAARLENRWAGPTLLVALSGPVATALPDFAHSGGVAPFGFVVLAAWSIGYAVGRQRRYALAVLRHREELSAARLAEARGELTQERLRIAREMHDVVAHSMSVITVQAAYGHLVVDGRPAEAKAALAVIESTGREVLVELRRLLGVLREDGSAAGPPELEPAARIGDLDRLVASASAAGLVVDLRVAGCTGGLPPGLELTAYRIVQESLTNVVRHARLPRPRATVVVEVGPAGLRIEVRDEGGPVDPQSGQGHGLVGMRERVSLYSGTLQAGPRPDGLGFEVLALLPAPATVTA